MPGKRCLLKYLYADSPRAPAPEDGNPAYASGGPAPQLRIEHVWKQQFSADSPYSPVYDSLFRVIIFEVFRIWIDPGFYRRSGSGF